jgi:hypothetical protein
VASWIKKPFENQPIFMKTGETTPVLSFFGKPADKI